MIEIKNTDLGLICPVGLGSMKAESSWSMDETFRIFDHYRDRGGNLFDTARVYSSFSKSEEYLGEWQKKMGNRHDIIIVSKGGHPLLRGSETDMHCFRLSREEMAEDLETSLRTMGTDYIDIYLYHRDDESRPVEELVETMETFVKKGLIRYYGCSNWSTARMKAAMDYAKSQGYRGLTMNQALLNAGSDNIEKMTDDTLVVMDPEMRAFHRECPEVLATAYSSFAVGFFSQYIAGGEAAVRDKQYLTPANIELAKQLEISAKEKGITLLQEVLSYFKTLDIQCLPLFTPRDEKGLDEVMDIFE